MYQNAGVAGLMKASLAQRREQTLPGLRVPSAPFHVSARPPPSSRSSTLPCIIYAVVGRGGRPPRVVGGACSAALPLLSENGVPIDGADPQNSSQPCMEKRVISVRGATIRPAYAPTWGKF